MKAQVYLVALLCFVSLHAVAAPVPQGVVVFGEAEKRIAADQWTVSFSIGLKRKDRASVVESYNETKKNLFAVLKKLGIAEKQVETESYFLSPWQEWKKNSYEQLGYQLSHTLSFRSNDLELIGKILQNTATINGFQVGNIEHSLQFETQQKVMKELYGSAFQNAKSKIDSILKASGKTFEKYVLISEDLNKGSDDGMGFGRKRGAMNAQMASPEGAVLELSLVPKTVVLTTNLRVEAQFK